MGFKFRRCSCGDEDNPFLYGEGMAKQYIREDNSKSNLCFCDFDGYVVECPACGAITRHYNIVEKAVEAWNREELEYAGESYL